MLTAEDIEEFILNHGRDVGVMILGDSEVLVYKGKVRLFFDKAETAWECRRYNPADGACVDSCSALGQVINDMLG